LIAEGSFQALPHVLFLPFGSCHRLTLCKFVSFLWRFKMEYTHTREI
jgi:hypothetical protein